MMNFILGKKGGGKSFVGMHTLIEELRLTKRIILTNLPIRYAVLRGYLHEKYGEDFDMKNRLGVLTDSQATRFWRYYAPGKMTWKDDEEEPSFEPKKIEGKVIAYETDDERGDFEVPDMRERGPDHPGVAYFIDEVHVLFSPQCFAKGGRECKWYLTQERKMSDQIFCLTQVFGNVDKAFRTMGQEYWYARNHMKEKLPLLGGLFRSASVFTISVFTEPYTGASQKPMETRPYRADFKGIGRTYDTARGVGIYGKAADTGAKRKGLPMRYLAVAVVVIIAAIVILPKYAVAALVKPAATGVVSVAGGAPLVRSNGLAGSPGVLPPVPPPYPGQDPGMPHARLSGLGLVEGTKELEKVYLTGHAKNPTSGVYTVWLSDGATWKSTDAQFQVLTDRMVKIDGKIYAYGYPGEARKSVRNWER